MVTTTQEIAALLKITRRAAAQRLAGVPCEHQAARGGQRKVYKEGDLPADIQVALAHWLLRSPPTVSANRESAETASPGDRARDFSSQSAPAAIAADARLEERARHFEFAPASRKARAQLALDSVTAWEELRSCGHQATTATKAVCARFNISTSTLDKRLKRVAGEPREAWLYLLLDHHYGRTSTAEMSAEAWEVLKADYLRPERPSALACIGRLRDLARARADWTVPSNRTLLRRLEKLPRAVKVLAREGKKALKRLYPAQQRSKAALSALAIVNADGYKHNVWVRFPDGEVVRAKTWYWQDVYSNKILAWRTDKTEHTDMIRLSFGDLVEGWGIPEAALMDNTLAAANKTMSGGVKHRFRFKVKPEEPDGVFRTLGVDPLWATPGWGQGKPIERAFGVGGIGEYIDKAPECAGAWTGASTLDKPEYSEGKRSPVKAVELATLHTVIAREIAAWNAREDRRGAITHGRSHDAVFDESYSATPIRRATETQRRLWLLATEPVRAGRDGSITLDAGRVVGEKLANRYWSANLVDYAGRMVAARFDPQRLHEGVHVYTADGRYLCFAECDRPAAFNDQLAGRERNRARNAYMRSVKEARAAVQRMDVLDVVKARAGDGSPVIPAPAAPARSIIAPQFRDPLERPRIAPAPVDDGLAEMMQRLEAESNAPKKVDVLALQTDDQKYAHWKRLQARLQAGEALDAGEEAFFRSFQDDMFCRVMEEGEEQLGRAAGNG